MNHMISGFVECQGINIHYLAKNIEAEEQLSLLFVPGVMMPAWIWEKQLDYFSKKYRVVAMDPRSHGESGLSTEGHYAFSLAKDIKELVDKLKLEPLVLIGWSLGVPQVVNYAAHFGLKGLKGLVLVDGLTGIDPSVPFYEATVKLWTEFQVDRPLKTGQFVRSIFKTPQKEEYIEKLIASALRTPTNTVMTLVENYILQDFRPLLPNIDIPTLIATIKGPRLEYMKSLEKLLPHCQLEIFETAGHALFVDEPERFNHLLDAFVKKL